MPRVAFSNVTNFSVYPRRTSISDLREEGVGGERKKAHQDAQEPFVDEIDLTFSESPRRSPPHAEY